MPCAACMMRRPHVIEQSGVKLQLGNHLSAKVRQVLLDGEYEEKELSLLRMALAPGDKVMELGTGLGFLASFCAKQIGSERVVTYEGNPQMERHIRRNFALNGVAPTLIMSLVGREAEERAFHLNRESWCSSTWKRPGTVSTITVPVRAFNEEVRQGRPAVATGDYERRRRRHHCAGSQRSTSAISQGVSTMNAWMAR